MIPNTIDHLIFKYGDTKQQSLDNVDLSKNIDIVNMQSVPLILHYRNFFVLGNYFFHVIIIFN